MLSDEEREAIDIIKNEINAFEIVITAMEKEIDDKDWLRKNILEIKEDILVRKTLLNLIKKQSKEIEELKEKCKEVVCVPEGTCFMIEPKDVNKKWEDKIKAKVEELDLAVFKNQTIYTVNKMQEIKFARLCLAELLEKE